MLHLFLRYRQTFLPFSDAKVRIFADTGKKRRFISSLPTLFMNIHLFLR